MDSRSFGDVRGTSGGLGMFLLGFAMGSPLPGSHMVETCDLIERDLCWHPQIITQSRFMDFVPEVKDRFRSF